MTDDYEVILLAAGSSMRFNQADGINKVLMPLNDRPVFDYSLRLFVNDPKCRTVWFVIKQENKPAARELLVQLYREVPSKLTWIEGGKERQDSVRKALLKMGDTTSSHVLVHDAARPFVTADLIEKLLTASEDAPAVTLGMPAKDSMKLVKKSFVECSLYRPSVWHIQTPQVFKKDILLKAMEKAVADNFYGNEEGELVERIGYPVKVIEGSDRNFKITSYIDYQLAELLRKGEK